MARRSLDQSSPRKALLTVLARVRDPVATRGPCVVVSEWDAHDVITDAADVSLSLELPCDVIAKTLLVLADANAVPTTEPASVFVLAIDPALEDNIQRYLRAIRDPIERRVIAPLALEELVFRLLRSGAAAVLRSVVERGRDVDPIQQAIRYMRSRAFHPLSVEDIARHVGMSASHFAHRFRAVARISPMRYLKQLRMQDARALLVADGLRVSEVAMRVGYESASHFTRDFKSYFGATPAEYTRRLKSAGSGESIAVPDIVATCASA